MCIILDVFTNTRAYTIEKANTVNENIDGIVR